MSAYDVSLWLKEKTRESKFSLIHEENMNYGYIRNLWSVKPIFLIIFSLYNIVMIAMTISANWDLGICGYLKLLPVEHIACGLIHISIYVVWIFAITEKLHDFTAKKYAKAVVKAIDQL